MSTNTHMQRQASHLLWSGKNTVGTPSNKHSRTSAAVAHCVPRKLAGEIVTGNGEGAATTMDQTELEAAKKLRQEFYTELDQLTAEQLRHVEVSIACGDDIYYTWMHL